MVYKVIPGKLDNSAKIVQLHFAIHDFSKKRVILMGAYSDEVGTRLGIIIAFHSNGAAMKTILTRI